MLEVPMRFEGEPLLWVVDDVYTPEECSNHVRWIEQSAPKLATNNAIYRDQDRVMRTDPEMAGDLFQRLRHRLPALMGQLRLYGLNDLLRFYRYKPGQQFPPHMDHWYRPTDRQISLHTVLVYFNDGFEGGATVFQEQIEATVLPKAGRVAIFQHKVRHEGKQLIRGTKYALRTDTLYEL
jgi:prolyl 4-hydroxylase